MRGRVDGNTVYLPEDQLPAFTLSLSDLQDPGKVRGWRSTTLRITANSDGQRALGGEHMAEVDTFRADAPPVLRIGEDSSALFEAPVVPLSRDRNETQAVSIFGNAKWFEFAKETKLREFPYGLTPIVDPVRQENSWTDDEQFDHWPLVNYGYLNAIDPLVDNVPPTYLHPAARVHRVVGDALASQGYTVIAHGTLAALWRKLVICDPAAKLKTQLRSNEYGAIRDDNATGISSTIPNIGSNPLAYPITTTDHPSPDITGAVWTQPYDGALRVYVNRLTLNLDPFSTTITGKRLRIVLYNTATNAVLKGLTSAPIASAQETVEFTGVWSLPSVTTGTTLGIGLQIDDNTGVLSTDVATSAEGNRYCVEFIAYDQEASEDLRPDDWVYQGGDPNGPMLDLASICPDMTLADLISDLCTALCLVVDTRTDGTVNLWFEREYLRKPANGVPVRDWTTRIDHTKAPIKRRIETPVRVLFKYADDERDQLIDARKAPTNDLGFGNAVYTFGAGVKKEETREVSFSATVSQYWGDLLLPTLIDTEADPDTDSRKLNPRLWIADGLRDGDWTWNTLSRSTYPMTYFEAPLEDFPTLGFQGYEEVRSILLGFLPAPEGLLTKYHLQRLRRLNGLVLECYLRVWDHELPDFDHGVPTLVDDGGGPAWYYPQECKGHRFMEEEPSKWVLVPISTREASTVITNPDIAYPEQNEPDPCWAQAAFPDTMETVDAVALSSEQADFEATAGTGGILVAGAGAAAANAGYPQTSTANGRPYYAQGGWFITWTGTNWMISDGSVFYVGTGDVATPDLCTGWTALTAPAPAPTVTVDTGDLVVGDRIFIRDHPAGGPPSNDWAEHTGHIAEFVGIGNGVGGGMWDYSIPGLGVVIRDLETPGVPNEYWQVYGCADTNYSTFGGYSGRVGIRYLLPIASLDPGPPATTNIEWPTTETGATVEWSGPDACRLCVLQYAEEADIHDAVFLDSPNMAAVPLGDAPGYTNGWALFTGTFTANFPVAAQWIRAKWMRGGQLQGYSDARAATA